MVRVCVSQTLHKVLPEFFAALRSASSQLCDKPPWSTTPNQTSHSELELELKTETSTRINHQGVRVVHTAHRTTRC